MVLLHFLAIIALTQQLHQSLVLKILDVQSVDVNDELKNRLQQRELVLDFAPLNPVPPNFLTEGHILADEPNLGQPDDVVCEVVDKTADSGYCFQYFEVD